MEWESVIDLCGVEWGSGIDLCGVELGRVARNGLASYIEGTFDLAPSCPEDRI